MPSLQLLVGDSFLQQRATVNGPVAGDNGSCIWASLDTGLHEPAGKCKGSFVPPSLPPASLAGARRNRRFLCSLRKKPVRNCPNVAAAGGVLACSRQAVVSMPQGSTCGGPPFSGCPADPTCRSVGSSNGSVLSPDAVTWDHWEVPRRFVVLLVSLPVVAGGWLSAHWLAYVLVAPHADDRSRLLAETGHHHAGAAPVFVACGITLLCVGLGLIVHQALSGASRPRVRKWPIALAAPAGFALQEHLERLIEFGASPVTAALEPTFIVGMVLQVPVAITAFVLVGALVAAGHAWGRAVRPSGSAVPRRLSLLAGVVLWPTPAPDRARMSALGAGHGERGPPLQVTT